MKKSRMETLIPIADNILRQQEGAENSILTKRKDNTFFVKSNYDGKISGFGVMVALSGLRPALAMYFNESSDVKTQPILEAIAMIIKQDAVYESLPNATAQSLLEHALDKDVDLKKLKGYVLEAAIALKLVVRTYELKR